MKMLLVLCLVMAVALSYPVGNPATVAESVDSIIPLEAHLTKKEGEIKGNKGHGNEMLREDLIKTPAKEIKHEIMSGTETYPVNADSKVKMETPVIVLDDGITIANLDTNHVVKVAEIPSSHKNVGANVNSAATSGATLRSSAGTETRAADAGANAGASAGANAGSSAGANAGASAGAAAGTAAGAVAGAGGVGVDTSIESAESVELGCSCAPGGANLMPTLKNQDVLGKTNVPTNNVAGFTKNIDPSVQKEMDQGMGIVHSKNFPADGKTDDSLVQEKQNINRPDLEMVQKITNKPVEDAGNIQELGIIDGVSKKTSDVGTLQRV